MLLQKENNKQMKNKQKELNEHPGIGSDPPIGSDRKRGAIDLFFIYGDNDLIVSKFTNASFQYDRDDLKSQSGYVFMLNGGIVSWKSSKQDTTEDSTTESDYIVASEAVWHCSFSSLALSMQFR